MKKWTFLIFLFSTNLSAANWSETSISYLRGSNSAQVFGSDNNRSELTIENASSFAYGDNFFWLDVTDPQSSKGSNDTELYGELSPRFSIGKIFNKHDSNRFVQDVLIASTLEFGNSGKPNRSKLIGLGFDLKIPYFTFFQYNFYIRDNLDKDNSTFQSTLAYQMPINISSKILLTWSAYIDIVHGDEGKSSNSSLVTSHWHTGQQLNFDIGNLWGKSNFLLGGFEFQHWSRKYGIKNGVVENNLKWMFKWVL